MPSAAFENIDHNKIVLHSQGRRQAVNKCVCVGVGANKIRAKQKQCELLYLMLLDNLEYLGKLL